MKWNIEKRGEDFYFSSVGGEIRCYLCDAEMYPRHAKKLKFSEVPYSGDFNCRAVDIYASCPNCCFEEVFGIAITEEEFDALSLNVGIFA